MWKDSALVSDFLTVEVSDKYKKTGLGMETLPQLNKVRQVPGINKRISYDSEQRISFEVV